MHENISASGPSVPLLGGLPYLMRDPLDFLVRAAASGPIVDLRLPMTKFYLLREPEDIGHVLLTANRSVHKDLFLRDLRRVVGDGLLTSEDDFWRRGSHERQLHRLEPAPLAAGEARRPAEGRGARATVIFGS